MFDTSSSTLSGEIQFFNKDFSVNDQNLVTLVRSHMKGLKDNKLLQTFLKTCIQWANDNDKLHEMSEFISTICPLNRLEEILVNEDQLFTTPELAKRRDVKTLYWLPAGPIEEEAISKRHWFVDVLLSILNFIPNTLKMFFEAFTFSDSSKNFTGLFEKYLVFEVMYRCFQMIFYFCEKMGSTVIPAIMESASIIHIVGLCIFGAIAIGSLIYNFFFRESMNIAGLKNCTIEWKNKHTFNRIEKGENGEVIDVCKLAINELKAGHNPIFVGPSGSGKTAIIQRMHQLLKNGAYPELNDMEFILVDNLEMLKSSGKYNYKNHLAKFSELGSNKSKKVVYILDNLNSILSQGGGRDVLEEFYKLTGPYLIIAALTKNEWEDLKKTDKSGVLTQNAMKKIELKTETDETLKTYLWNHYWKKARDLPITNKAIDKIITFTTEYCSKDKEQPLGRPKKALDIFERVVVECRENMKEDKIHEAFNRTIEKFKEENKRTELNELQVNLDKEKERVKKIQQQQKKLADFHFNYVTLREKFTSLSENEKNQYYLANFFGLEIIKKKMDDEINSFRKDRIEAFDNEKDPLPSIITEELVEKVINELQLVGTL